MISQYLESGKSKGINEMVGDEIAADEFPLIEAYDIYHKIDFANIGIPLYIRKVHSSLQRNALFALAV